MKNCKHCVLTTFKILQLKHYHPPLEKGVTLHSNKPESHPPKIALCQLGSVEIGQVVLEHIRRFLNVVKVFYIFAIISPWQKVWTFI